jgi:hypothetical protein
MAASLFLAEPAAAQPSAALPALTVSGTGAAPNSKITLAVSPQDVMAVQSSEDGKFAFKSLPYDYDSFLTLKLNVPVNDTKKKALAPTNLVVTLQPNSFAIDMEGTATRAASIALSVNNEGSGAAVANSKGYFKISAPLSNMLKPGNSRITASIINVRQSCCPQVSMPTLPLTIMLESTAVPVPAPVPAAPATRQPALPAPIPLPYDRSGELIRGDIIQTAEINLPSVAYASFNNSWGRGFRRFADQIVTSITMQARMIGGFIDAKVHLDAQRSLQRLAAEAMRDYTPGEALCRFGTLSRSLAASEGRSDLTKRALNEILTDRETMRRMTINSTKFATSDRVRLFQDTFCKKYDENNALELANFCGAAVSSLNLNKDIDYTRLIDTPLTLDVNFVTTPNAAERQANSNVIAFANNLFANENFRGFSAENFKEGILDDDVQRYRAAVAARGIVRNSFASLVGMKAEGTAGSGAYMRGVMTQMGLSAAEATRLLGTNPSYFAQMEVLTKKIYQDPAFFADLYDKPANTQRQRGAMKGISLQQQRDLLDVLHRREMLLSALLELKIKNFSLEEKK